MKAWPAAGEDEVARVAETVAAILPTAPFVNFAYGHGSFFLGLPYRDVDVACALVRGADPCLLAISALADRCEAAVGRPVDLHVMEGADTGFAASASGGRLLCARDPEEAAAFGDLARRMAWDFRPLQDQALRDLRGP